MQLKTTTDMVMTSVWLGYRHETNKTGDQDNILMKCKDHGKWIYLYKNIHTYYW